MIKFQKKETDSIMDNRAKENDGPLKSAKALR
jgi:hypothetical protein